MRSKDKEVEGVIYSYATNSNASEEENRLLRETVSQLNTEIEKFKRNPLMICTVKALNKEGVVIQIPNGNEFLVERANDCDNLKIGDSVLVEQKNLTIVKTIENSKKFTVGAFVVEEKPTTDWKEIGGMQKQVEEIQEVVELPLKKPHLFKEVGISPPKGILLHGPPGTGKTLLAKAVAASTNSTFIEIVASELVQKFIGEGAKLVKEVFELAREESAFNCVY